VGAMLRAAAKRHVLYSRGRLSPPRKANPPAPQVPLGDAIARLLNQERATGAGAG
jgi:hypothetical protein